MITVAPSGPVTNGARIIGAMTGDGTGTGTKLNPAAKTMGHQKMDTVRPVMFLEWAYQLLYECPKFSFFCIHIRMRNLQCK